MVQIALHKPYNILGKIITTVTRGKYSHCSIILSDGSVIESRPFHGVRKLNHIGDNESKGQIIDIFDISLTKKQEKELSIFLNKQVGKGYDYWMVFGFILYSTREGRKSYGRWFCSELLFAAFEKVKCYLFERVEPWKISPSIVSWSNKIKFNRTFVVP